MFNDDAEKNSSMKNLAREIRRLFDFEYAQPLYDLAFLLEIDAKAKNEKIPKYRTLALWKAAISFDSYESRIANWLEGHLVDDDLDQVPSNRIKQHLQTIRESGTLPELESLKSKPNYKRALDLRCVRGFGPALIVEYLALESLTEELLRKNERSTGKARPENLKSFDIESAGHWQCPHVLEPLLRILSCFEEKYPKYATWQFQTDFDLLSPITGKFEVGFHSSDQSKFKRRLNSVIKQDVMFSKAGRARDFEFQHCLGWWVKFNSCESDQETTDLGQLRIRSQYSTADSALKIKSDLHMHSTWSDGAASIKSMATAANEIGHEFIAITDHSRTCKLQRGLNPIEWLRQANAIQSLKSTTKVVHGIEVDILNDGSLDLPLNILRAADVVVGSVHSSWTQSKEKNTNRLVNAVQTGCIDIIGHPTSALTGKPGVPNYVRQKADVDWCEVFKICASWQVALEFNCFPSRFDLPLEMLEQAIEAGCWISFGSDAHARSHLSNINYAYEVVSRLNTDNILNTLSLTRFRKWKRDAIKKRAKLSPEWGAKIQGDLFASDDPVQEINARLAPNPKIPNGSTIVGIDLTAGVKATGVAFLKDACVETCSLTTDEELLEYVTTMKPAIVSIDSPLGLPGGGSEIQKEAGIVRMAEHDLSSIGIPSYPALIDSMRDLTLRGIRLRKEFEKLDFAPTVIESYPGAAQDILCLPRKQRGLELLKDGLKGLGLTGPGVESDSHDEIDAITSALVGRYFEAGRYEPMGIPSEAQLIVPKHCILDFDSPPVICLAGHSGVGKSVVGRYLATIYGFEWIKTRNLIRDLLIEDCAKPASKRLFDQDVDPTNIQEVHLREFGFLIKKKYEQKPLREYLARKLNEHEVPVVVDAIRAPDDVSSNDLNRPVYTWYLTAKESLSKKRIEERAKKDSTRTIGKAKLDRTVHEADFEISSVIENNGSLEDLRWQIDDVLFSAVKIIK